MSKKGKDVGNIGGCIGRCIGQALRETCYFLTILFCALRACGIINWHWFWIMSPIFSSWVLAFICLGVTGLILGKAVFSE